MLQPKSKILSFSLILLGSVLLVGCTSSSNQVTPYTKEQSNNGIKAQVPLNWEQLEGKWINKNTLFAYGDSNSNNTQSFIVNKHINSFDPTVESFDQTFCEKQYQLMNSEDYFDGPSTNYSLEGVSFVSNDTVQQCEINYRWKKDDNATNARVRNIIRVKDGHVFIVELSASDNAEFSTLENILSSLTIE